MKKVIVLFAAIMLLAGVAVAADYEGKVTMVKGDKVTIEITKGKASKIDVGAAVEVEVKKGGKAPKKKGGMDMLQGC